MSQLQKVKPFPGRTAIPLYFYPFLSPLHHRAEDGDRLRFLEHLQVSSRPKEPILVYVHIPFCDSICAFCGFYRVLTLQDPQVFETYIKLLQAEIVTYGNSPYLQGRPITAVYIGGGSPSVLPPKCIEALLTTLRQNFVISPKTEFTFEGEIRTLRDPARLEVIRALGATRVSFGVQSFDPAVRRSSGLVPPLSMIFEICERLREFGFSINLDLMYGLPGQTLATWHADLSQAVALDPANIDIYDTVLYPQSQLFRLRHKLKDLLPSEEIREEMFSQAVAFLRAQGYRHETIEDFAKPGQGYQMKKLVYGNGNGSSEIVSIGASSIGFLRTTSYRNLPPGPYGRLSPEDIPPLPIELCCPVGEEQRAMRALVFFPKLLKLEKTAIPFKYLEVFQGVFENLKQRGLVREDGDFWRVTDLGLLWTDNISMEFLEAHERRRVWKISY